MGGEYTEWAADPSRDHRKGKGFSEKIRPDLTASELRLKEKVLNPKMAPLLSSQDSF
jgi:hypothetical protein